MNYRLDFDKKTRELIPHLPPFHKKKLNAALRTIAKNPYEGKALQEELQGLYSYRIQTWRIIYLIHTSKKLIQVLTIGPRRTIYETVAKKLEKEK